jgi:DNA polymerase III epsilon subunit-like protein
VSGRIFAVDCETTGTDPVRHVAWDIALVGEDKSEHQWFIKPDLKTADPMALRIGRYYERTAGLKPSGTRANVAKWAKPDEAAAEIACLLDGATLLGHNPPFDAAFIGAFLRRHGHVLTADHHLIDTGTLVTGYLAGARRGFRDAWEEDGRLAPAAGRVVVTRYPEPMGKHLADMARAVGVDPLGFEQHTAIGDARLALAVYRAVMGGGS